MALFVLFPDIIIVNGAKKSLLMDFRSHSYMSLESEIVAFLENRKVNLDDLNKEDLLLVDYLVENEYGLICSEEEGMRFKEINISWDYPALISNAILEIGVDWRDSVIPALKELNAINCEHIELRINREIEVRELGELIKECASVGTFGLELILPYSSDFTKSIFAQFNEKYNTIIYHVTFFNVPASFSKDNSPSITRFKYIAKPFSCLDCGSISKSKFITDIPFYTESMNFNNCLNRKVAISENGDIKNCPSLKTSYGNIKKDNFGSVIASNDFQKIWHITKDEIETCQDCEFRYVCTDCRAFVENEFSKPSKCGYNPYTATWEESSQHQLKT